MGPPGVSRGLQRGWIGSFVLLLALAVVALLSKAALESQGLLGARSAPRSGVAPAGLATGDATTAAPTASTPLDRARDVERMVRQQSVERAERAEPGVQ